MKSDGQPIRDFVPLNSQCTNDPHDWLNDVFLFSTEIWAEQLKKHALKDVVLCLGHKQKPFQAIKGRGLGWCHLC